MTIYLGDYHRRGIVGAKRTSHEDHRQVTIDTPPMGEDIAVFDRGSSGHHGEFQRDAREDMADAYLMAAGRDPRRIKVQTVDTGRNWNNRQG
jgi:hypothetical protein